MPLAVLKVAAILAALQQPSTGVLEINPCVLEPTMTLQQADQLLANIYDQTPKVDGHHGADEYFGWKDIAAAQRVGKSLHEYVIEGVLPKLRINLARMFVELSREGFMPGITSGFRDVWRQALATGHKASPHGSYHGSRPELGWGHGEAFDIVSRTPLGAGYNRPDQLVRSEALWAWVDAHGAEFDIGRPYGDRDAGHVGLRNGPEYLAKHDAKHRFAGHKHHHTAKVRLAHAPHHKHVG